MILRVKKRYLNRTKSRFLYYMHIFSCVLFIIILISTNDHSFCIHCQLEALECLSSALSILGNTNQGNESDFGHPDVLHGVLKPSAGHSSNWMSSEVAFHLENHVKLNSALEYFSKLVREHPSWEDTTSVGVYLYSRECESHQFVELFENFQQKLCTGLEYCEQKFSLAPFWILTKVHTRPVCFLTCFLSCAPMTTFFPPADFGIAAQPGAIDPWI